MLETILLVLGGIGWIIASYIVGYIVIYSPYYWLRYAVFGDELDYTSPYDATGRDASGYHIDGEQRLRAGIGSAVVTIIIFLMIVALALAIFSGMLHVIALVA